MKRISSVILSAVAAVCVFSGCSKKSSGPVSVEIWHTYNGTQQDALSKIAADFNASQSEYEVKVLAQDYSGFADTVYNAVANGVGPSIIFNYGSTAVDYAKEGLAVDISAFMAEDEKKGDTVMRGIIDSLPRAMQADVKGFAGGGIYYLPGCTTGPVYFYNKTLFDELGLNPPKDWKELENVARTVYEKKGIAGFHSDGLVDNIQSMIMQSGLGYIDTSSRKVLFAGEKLAEIYQWYADCCRKGWFEFNTVGKYASEDLVTGAIASFSGSCVNDQYIKMDGAELGMAPWISSSDGRSFYTAWNRGPIFLKRNVNADRGAYEFVKFFLSPENNCAWASANSALSPYGTTQKTDAYQSYIKNLPETSALPCVQANLAVSGSFPNVHGGSLVRNILVEYLNNVVDGKMTAQEAVAGVERDCNAALAE